MKKLLILLFIFCSINSIFSQQEDRSGGKSYSYKPYLLNGIFNSSNENYELKIEGSPYENKSFKDVLVAQVNTTAKMRYNGYKDEFEFITPEFQTLILDKIEIYANLQFVDSKIKYLLTSYTNANNKIIYGYLIDIHENGDYGLLRKDNISIQDEKIPKTTLESGMPAKYYSSGTDYFFRNKTFIQEFPKNKKRLCKIFPDKKESIELFVKENTIDFDNIQDKIKIIDYLAKM